MTSLAPSDTSEKLLRCVRAGFVTQGSSLNAWCALAGVKRQNAAKALSGEWAGPKASVLVTRIKEAAGVKQ